MRRRRTARAKRSAPRRRRRVIRRRRRMYANAPHPNPPAPRRRRRRRSYAGRTRYRRNQPRVTTGFLWDAGYVTGGFIGTRIFGNMILPMVPQVQTFPFMRILGKGVTAWLVGWGGGMMLGRRAGNLLMVGGFVDVLDDAVKTYVAPFMPMLGQNDLGVYPQLGRYVEPQLGWTNGNMGMHDAPWSVGTSEFSNEDAV